MDEKKKRDWKKVVEESKGASLFLPEKFLEKAKVWLTRHNDHKALAKKHIEELSEAEIRINTELFQPLVLEIRSFLKESGRRDAFTGDLGFDEAALAEGEFVLNISNPR